MNDKKVLVIGSAVVDVRIPVSHIPVRSEDLNVYSQDMSLGGCGFNVCDCLHRASVPCIPFLPVAGGVYGDFVRQKMKERGISSRIPSAAGENGCCYCFVEPDGERTFICYHGAEYLFMPEWFLDLERSGEAAQISAVYICGLEIEEETGRYIIEFLERHPEYRVYFAPSSRICMIDPDKMRRIFALSPVLHLNADEACSYTASEAFLKAGGKRWDAEAGREEAGKEADGKDRERDGDSSDIPAAAETSGHEPEYMRAAKSLYALSRNTVVVTLGAGGTYLLMKEESPENAGADLTPAVCGGTSAESSGVLTPGAGERVSAGASGVSMAGAAERLSAGADRTTLNKAGTDNCRGISVPGVHVSNITDTIGAGDSHIGSIIALLHKGFAPVEAVSAANRVAASVVQQEGALLPEDYSFPSAKETVG